MILFVINMNLLIVKQEQIIRQLKASIKGKFNYLTIFPAKKFFLAFLLNIYEYFICFIVFVFYYFFLLKELLSNNNMQNIGQKQLLKKRRDNLIIRSVQLFNRINRGYFVAIAVIFFKINFQK